MSRETTTEYYSGQGIISMAETVNEVPQGFYDIGDVPSMQVSYEVEKYEVKESRSGNRLVAFSEIKGRKGKLSLSARSWHKQNLLKVLQASATEIASGDVTDVPIKAYLGAVVFLPDMKISALVLKDAATELITYELDKNYTIKTETGGIYFMTAAEQTAAGATNVIAEGAELIGAYTRAAQVDIKAFGAPEKEYALKFEGVNTARENEPILVTVHRLKLDPAKAMQYINDEVALLELEGEVLATTVGYNFVTTRILGA